MIFQAIKKKYGLIFIILCSQIFHLGMYMKEKFSQITLEKQPHSFGMKEDSTRYGIILYSFVIVVHPVMYSCIHFEYM